MEHAEMEEQAAVPSQIEGWGLKFRWRWSRWQNKWRPSMLSRPVFED